MRILTGKLIRHCRDLIVERSYPETAVTSGEFGGLVGIEPTTPSMPWNSQNRIVLTAKALKVGRVGKNR